VMALLHITNGVNFTSKIFAQKTAQSFIEEAFRHSPFHRSIVLGIPVGAMSRSRILQLRFPHRRAGASKFHGNTSTGDFRLTSPNRSISTPLHFSTTIKPLHRPAFHYAPFHRLESS